MAQSVTNYLSDRLAEEAPADSWRNRSCGRRVYDVVATAFSFAGNWPFYQIAAAFGNKVSRAYGATLGTTEFTSYSIFRTQNYQEIGDRLSAPAVQVENADEPLLEGEDRRPCRQTALKVLSVSLGLIAQTPLMIMAYYENDKSLVFPILVGLCEAAPSIISLLMSADALTANPDPTRTHFLDQLGEFERSLDPKNLPSTAQTLVSRISSTTPPLPPSRLAKTLGVILSLYITVASGAATYSGILRLRHSYKPLAATATTLVSLINLYFLNSVCISAVHNYMAFRSRPNSLSYQLAPKTHVLTHLLAHATSALSYGTTALAIRDYLPHSALTTPLLVLAPLSAHALTHGSLTNLATDVTLRLHAPAPLKRILSATASLRRALPSLDVTELHQAPAFELQLIDVEAGAAAADQPYQRQA